MINNIRKKGLTGFDLKILALILMLLDHIHYFFGFTGKVPLLFSYLGRLSGGLFLFTFIQGYTHTKSKKKYFLRIYVIGAIMGLIKHIIMVNPALTRGDGFYPMNGIFSTFTLLIIMFYGIDLFKDGKKIKGSFIFLLPIIWGFGMNFTPPQLMPYAFLIGNTILPSLFITEGGIYIILLGLIMYLFKSNKNNQAFAYFLFSFAWMTILPVMFITPINLKLFFTEYYEWFGSFAAIFMILYNGEKGKSMKGLFYAFYPLHIYILYILSIITYNHFY